MLMAVSQADRVVDSLSQQPLFNVLRMTGLGSSTERNCKAENHLTYFGYFAPVFGQDG